VKTDLGNFAYTMMDPAVELDENAKVGKDLERPVPE